MYAVVLNNTWKDYTIENDLIPEQPSEEISVITPEVDDQQRQFRLKVLPEPGQRIKCKPCQWWR